MSRIETIGNATLYLGDCREILPSLTQGDAVVTDPPYGTNVTDWDVSIDPVTVGAVLSAGRQYCAFFYSNTRLAHLLTAVRDHGRDTWVVVWHKSNAMGFERRFAPQWVPIVVAYRGNPPFWGKDLFVCPIVPQAVDHPTPKQPAITQWLVERATQPGQTVIDPFMGSGTTALSCAKLGRKFVGIEIDQKYFDAACRRIDEAAKQYEMFAP
jgi:site-specific DNA-methyltransferase (adenine-specific)